MSTQKQPLNHYLELHYPVTIHADENGGFVAEILDLPGCITQAETVNETWALIEDARKAWLTVAHQNGDSIPEPLTGGTCERPLHERFRAALCVVLQLPQTTPEDDILNRVASIASTQIGTPQPLAGHFREGPNNWAEWSIPMDVDVDEDGKPYRLFVRLDDLIEVFESPVTSAAPTARELGHAKKLVLTSDEAEWLQRVLPLALARKERG